MTDANTHPEPAAACVSCGHTDADAPLLQFRFRGSTGWICSSCLPILIHQPERLAAGLPGAETIPNAPHGKRHGHH